jgi:hypothetical protein
VTTTAEAPFTILDAGREVAVPARVAGGTVRLSADALEQALGLHVEGDTLCSDAMCIPVPDGEPLVADDGVDLATLARVLDRPLAVDVEERAAYLGVPAGERRRVLASLTAPDFTLPDLAGRMHSLSEQRGRKVLLVAWASW